MNMKIQQNEDEGGGGGGCWLLWGRGKRFYCELKEELFFFNTKKDTWYIFYYRSYKFYYNCINDDGVRCCILSIDGLCLLI